MTARWFNRIEDIPAGETFDLIVSDPPWRFLTYSEKGKLKKSAELHYQTMTLAEIKALPIATLAAPNCALKLWATVPMFQEALEVVRSWGFTYKSQGSWVKTTKHKKLAFGTGYRLRNAHEIWIVATRGNPKNTRGERSVLMAGVRAHSQKPDEFYQMAERWMPGARRLDLFGRELRPGWTVVGDEADKFGGSAAEWERKLEADLSL
jgi:N6-adenosine-specific RNA methylase IME4